MEKNFHCVYFCIKIFSIDDRKNWLLIIYDISFFRKFLLNLLSESHGFEGFLNRSIFASVNFNSPIHCYVYSITNIKLTAYGVHEMSLLNWLAVSHAKSMQKKN